MLLIFLILFVFLGLKLIEKLVNKYRKQSYKINSETTVLITGACSGIGKQLALNFAENFKCRLVIYDILDQIPTPLNNQLQKLGSSIYYYKCDVSKFEEIEKTVLKTYENVQKIDILVNNAGIVNGKSVLDLSIEQIQKVTAVNYLGPVYLIKTILPKMIQAKIGHIVNIASIAHLIYGINLSDYSASKAALYNFHSGLRLELKKSGVNIATTVINPHVINTGMFEGMTTRLNLIFPTLDEVFVGKTIFNSILEKREVVYIPWFYGNLWCLMNFVLPHNFLEKFLLFTRIYVLAGDSMKKFIGRSKKD